MFTTMTLIAAATETAAEVERWFDYPLLRLGDQTVTVLTVAKIIFWITTIITLNVLFQRMILRRLLKHTRLDLGLQFAIAKIFGYIVVGLGFYIALVTSGVNLSSLAVVAGALGLGIGFGLQGIVSNFVSGIVLLAERPVSVGDRIEVEGAAGRVTKISLRATTVVTNDNISIIVPNSQLTSTAVTNWSHGGPRVRLRIPVGVAYGTDPEKLKALLLSTVVLHREVLKTPEPVVYFDSFGDNALNFEVAVWTDTMTHAPRRFKSELNFLIERALRVAKIEIPFPQRVVHLHRMPEDEPAKNGSAGITRTEAAREPPQRQRGRGDARQINEGDE